MKRLGTVLLMILFVAGLPCGLCAQDESLTELIQRLGGDLVTGYTQPLVTALGTAIGTGLYHQAGTHGTLGFDFGVQAMFIPVPDKAKTFKASVLTVVADPLNPGQYDTTRTEVTANTVLGPDAVTAVPNGIPPELPGGVGISMVPLAVPQLSVGLSNGFEALVRYMKIPLEGDDISFFGFGLKYELTAMPPLRAVPLDIAVQYAYQKVDVGDIVSGKTSTVNLEASKTLPIITPYIGLGWENTSIDLDYTFEYTDPTTNLPASETVAFSVEGKNKFRTVLGVTLSALPFLKLNGDINLGRYTCYGAGLSFSFR
jgi:hypothetical protein